MFGGGSLVSAAGAAAGGVPDFLAKIPLASLLPKALAAEPRMPPATPLPAAVPAAWPAADPAALVEEPAAAWPAAVPASATVVSPAPELLAFFAAAHCAPPKEMRNAVFSGKPLKSPALAERSLRLSR